MSPGPSREPAGLPRAPRVFRNPDRYHRRAAPDAPPPRQRGRRRTPAPDRGSALILYGAALAYFTSIGAGIPTLPRYLVGPLHGSGVTVGIAVASFSVGAIAARLPVGAAADRWGWRRRSLLVTGATVLATSTALLVAAPSPPAVFALRALAGIADALFYTAAAATAYELAPAGRAGAAVSHFTMAAYLGLLAGPVLGETLRALFGFGWVWAGATAAAGAAALLAALLPVQAPRPDRQPRAPDNTGPGRHLVPRGALVPGVVLLVSTLGVAGYNSFVALYASSLGQRDARLEFAVFAIVTLLVRAAGGRLLDGHRLEPLLRATLGLSATGLLLIALLRTPVGLLVGTVVFAVGQAPTFPALIALTAARVPAARRAAAVATLTTCFDLAYGAAAFALGALWQRAGFPALWLAAAAAALTGSVLLTVGPPAPLPPPPNPTPDRGGAT